MTPEQVEKLQKQYCFPNEIRIIVPCPEDRVISGLPGYIALYEEFFLCKSPISCYNFYELVAT